MHAWTEKYDSDTVIIGELKLMKYLNKWTHISWAAIHIDGFHELFGGDAKEAVVNAKGVPVEVCMIVTRVDDEDVSGIEEASHHAMELDKRFPKDHAVSTVNDWFQNMGG